MSNEQVVCYLASIDFECQKFKDIDSNVESSENPGNQYVYNEERKRWLTNPQYQEIVQVPCVLGKLLRRKDGSCCVEIVQSFNRYCKTKLLPLDPECTKFTKITEKQVENGSELPKALDDLDAFIDQHVPSDAKVYPITCGNFDLAFTLPYNAKNYPDWSVPARLRGEYYNLKDWFEALYSDRIRTDEKRVRFLTMPDGGEERLSTDSMTTFLKVYIDQSQHHNGLYDAETNVRLINEMLKKEGASIDVLMEKKQQVNMKLCYPDQ